MPYTKHHCTMDKPDCFNCQYSDCIASLKDINRQLAIEKMEALQRRNAEILYAFLHGGTLNGLADRYDMSYENVRRILHNFGVDVVKEKSFGICKKKKSSMAMRA